MVTREQLLEFIRRGSEPGATQDDREAGAQACHAMSVLLGAKPGQRISLHGAPPPPSSSSRPDMGLLLDLATARLRSFLDSERAKATASSETPATSPTP